MATTRYTLKQMTDISFSGFELDIPTETFNTINYLCSQLNVATLNDTMFTKKRPIVQMSAPNATSNDNRNKKRKGNKAFEVTDEEWESIRAFQTTKIEEKVGIDVEIDALRLLLNKLTDKTFLENREKIIEKINTLTGESSENLNKVSEMIYEISSTNKFYSKIFANLYAELATNYEWINETFKNKFENIMSNYTCIKHVDPDKDYDGFCEMNKTNERRRSVTTFVLNLSLNGFLKKSVAVNLLHDILAMIMSMIQENDKKNEVDELTEHVGILFNQQMIEEVASKSDKKVADSAFTLDDTIVNTVSKLAKLKSKDYPSLSNKAIFKYMDLVEM